MAAMSKEEFITMIEGMTVLELHEIVKALEERFGVSAAAPMAFAAAPGAGPRAAARGRRRRRSSTSSSPVSAPTRSRSSRSSASSPASG